VRAEALEERQRWLDAPAQALGGGAVLHHVQQLPQGLAGQLPVIAVASSSD